MNKNATKMKRNIIFIIISVVIIISIILLLKSCNDTNHTINSTVPTETNSLDFLSFGNNTNKISIPGMDGINLKSGQLNQIVDFYNPDNNNCLFKIQLYLSDNSLIWESNYIEPAEHITNITLKKALKKGTYKNCKLLYKCFTIDSKSPLNNGEVLLEINTV